MVYDIVEYETQFVWYTTVLFSDESGVGGVRACFRRRFERSGVHVESKPTRKRPWSPNVYRVSLLLSCTTTFKSLI